MRFFYYSLSRWVRLNMFYSVCFVPLPYCGTYEKPHLPFTVKWIHRKSFHRGVSRSESKVVWGDRCETQHEPLHPSLGPVCPHLSPWSPTQLNTSLKRACYSHHTAVLINRVLISNVSQIHSSKYLFHCHVHVNDFANCAKGIFLRKDPRYMFCSLVYGGLWIKYMYSAKVVTLGTRQL